MPMASCYIPLWKLGLPKTSYCTVYEYCLLKPSIRSVAPQFCFPCAETEVSLLYFTLICPVLTCPVRLRLRTGE
jgi:hypothetical protein